MGVTLSGTLRCVNEDEASRVRGALEEHIRLTWLEPGCVSFEVTPTDDPFVWNVAEEFVDPAAFDAHQMRAGSSDWAQETKGIAREYTIKGMP